MITPLRERWTVEVEDGPDLSVQVEGLAGGHLSPHPSFVGPAGSLRPGRRRWRCQPVTVTALGTSTEVCEGTDGHQFGLPRGGHLPWGCCA
jgi:hypothetical protein